MGQLRNIVVINDFDYINGGTSQIAITTANSLAACGYKVYFFSAVSDPEKKDLSLEVQRVNTGQYDILKDPSRLRSSRQGIWNAKAESQLRNLLEKFDPTETMVHIHGWIKALSPSVGRVLSLSGFKTIMTLHDYFVACPNGGFFNYQTNAICSLAPMSAQCVCTNCDSRSYLQKIWRVVRQTVQSNMGRIPYGIHNFIAVSNFSARILQPFLPKQARIFHIGNPVNYPFTTPKRANTGNDRLLFIGRLSPEKGAELACEASRISKSKLSVIGDGELKEQLMVKYPEVEFKGWLPPSEVFSEMLTSTALIFPSILYETLGLTVLEAFSVGLPVIVSDKCAASELVNERNGVLFESGNPQDLAKKISELLIDKSEVERKSKFIFDSYWKSPSTVEKYMKELIKAYHLILSDDLVNSFG